MCCIVPKGTYAGAYRGIRMYNILLPLEDDFLTIDWYQVCDRKTPVLIHIFPKYLQSLFRKWLWLLAFVSVFNTLSGMMRGRLSIQECCTHTVVVERALPPPYCTSLPLPAAARSQSPLSFNLLMPLQNDSISLQISGVKSGPIWSESTDYRDCHIENLGLPSYGRKTVYLTSPTRRVWC